MQIRPIILVLAILLPALGNAYGSCFRGLCTGQEILNIGNNNYKARINYIYSDGTYYLEYVEGPYQGLYHLVKERELLAKTWGCYKGICVQDKLLNLDRDFAQISLIGIQYNGRFVIKYQSGEFNNKTGNHWMRYSLAETRGCYSGLCVNDRVSNNKHDGATAKIIALQYPDRFVLEYEQERQGQPQKIKDISRDDLTRI